MLHLRSTYRVCASGIGALLLGSIAAQGPTDGQRPTEPIDRRECAECHAEVKSHPVTHAPVKVDACSSCHRVTSAEEHTFSTPDGLCRNCHHTSSPEGRHVHAPRALGDCTGCHDPHGGKDKKMVKTASNDTLCLGCHDDATDWTGYAHSKQTSCTACHVPHSSDHPSLLRRPPESLCLDCHDAIRDTLQSANVKHGPVTDDRGCLNCHAAHSSEHSPLLVDETNALCLGCHDRELERSEGGWVGNVREEIESAAHVHRPAGANCAACHESHGAEDYRLLNAAYPEELYVRFREKSYALCLGCHDSQAFTEATTTTATGFRDGDFNLHRVHVGRKRTCRICHRTHAGPNNRLVRSSVPYGRGGWNLSIGFTQTPDGGSCARACHESVAYDRTVADGDEGP